MSLLIFSKDMSSAYPAVMLQKKFPMSRFVNTSVSSDSELLSEIDKGERCYLIDCRFIGLKIKTMQTIPYIASAKAIPPIRGARYDNGRILCADEVGLVLTDIDFKIIAEQYTYDEVKIDNIYSAKYDYLPNEFRQYIFDRYIKKCELKPTNGWRKGDKYLYAKEKNKINANFGMTLTDIVHDIIEYVESYEGCPFTKEKPSTEEALIKHYKSKSTFLVYQWGLWVTAWCRYRLQQAINGVGYGAIYCDTDSVKFIGDHEELFERLNNEILEETAKCGFDTEYTREDGVHFSLGLWEDDDGTPYKAFVTLGSKKYAYIDSDSELHITVAGLSKEKGCEWLKRHGGIKDFAVGTVIPPGKSGRTSAHYQDSPSPRTIRIFDPQQKKWVNIITGSSIAIENVPYTFGITDEYSELLESLDKPIM